MMTARKERFTDWTPTQFPWMAEAQLITDGWEALAHAWHDGSHEWTIVVRRRSLAGDKRCPWATTRVTVHGFPKARAALARRLPYPALRVAVSALRMPPCA